MGRLRRRLLLALSLLLLFVAALVALAPTLAAGPAARAAERGFAADYEGELAIGALDLGWFGQQVARDVQLIDPGGALVLEATAELPPLLQLVRARGRDLGTLVVTATADLVADDEGVTNLERALRTRDGEEESAPPPAEREEPAETPDEGEGDPSLPALDLSLTLTRVTWSDPRTRRTGAPLEYRDLHVRVTTAADGGVELRGERLPTGLADAMLAQDGLLVDVLGRHVELELRGGFPLDSRPLELDFESPGATLAFTGALDDGLLVAREGDALAATVPLNPLFTERVVGPLVPVLFGLSKPAGAAPVGVEVTGFRLPLDGDLARLDGDVTLALGEVTYQLLPGLQDVLAKFDETTELRLSKLEPLTVQVRGGVAHYERLAIEVADHELVFDGRYDLASSELGLATEVPLKIFGSKVVRALDDAREYLDPELKVPLELSGTWRRPKLRVADEFLETVVKDAARGALKNKLRDLLDR